MNKPLRWLWVLGWILVSCSTNSPEPSPTETPVILPQSAWGAINLIGQAQQLDAPASLALANNELFTWTGADDIEARHYAYSTNGNSQIIALRAYYPMMQTLYPAGRKALLLWLDRTVEREALILQSALISADGIAEIGSVPVSDIPTRRYSAVGTDLIRVVWSGGTGSITNLYLHEIDSQSRPFGFAELRRDADYPALVRDLAGDDTLYWLENQGRDVFMAQFDTSAETVALTTPQRIAQTTHLKGTDALHSLFVAHDDTHRYLLWNIQRMNGEYEVWFSTGRLDENMISEPVLWMPASDSSRTVDTSFNSGTVDGGTIGTVGARWARPLSMASDIVPVAVNVGTTLGVAYLRNGTLYGYETVVTNVLMGGLPMITSDASRNLILTWSQIAQPNAYLIMTRTGE